MTAERGQVENVVGAINSLRQMQGRTHDKTQMNASSHPTFLVLRAARLAPEVCHAFHMPLLTTEYTLLPTLAHSSCHHLAPAFHAESIIALHCGYLHQSSSAPTKLPLMCHISRTASFCLGVTEVEEDRDYARISAQYRMMERLAHAGRIGRYNWKNEICWNAFLQAKT